MTDWEKHYLKFIGVVAINASVYLSYRLYIHKLNTKIKKLNSENEDLLKKLKLDLNPVLIKNFVGKEKLLNKFNFVEIRDELAPLKIALFDYKGYIFALRKYSIHNRPEYTLLAETQKLFKAGLSCNEMCKEFMEKMKMSKIPVVWENQYYEQFEDKVEKKIKVKRKFKIKIEKDINKLDD